MGWNSDGRRLASGSVDTTIKITRVDDTPQFAHEIDLKGISDTVTSLQWHPHHPDKLASVMQQDKNVRFWDARDRKNTATVPTPAANLNLTWSGDGHYVAVGDKQETVSVLDVRRMKILSKHPNSVQINGLAWSGDVKLFFQGTSRGELEVHSFPGMKKLRALQGHTASVYAVAIDRANKYVATGGADAMVNLWSMDDFCCLRNYIKMNQPVRAMNFSHDSRYLAWVVEEQNVLEVEDVEDGVSLGRVQLRMRADDVAWNPKHHMLAYPGDWGRDNIGEFGSVEFRWLQQK